MAFMDNLKKSPKNFVVVTADFSGLGLAKMLQDHGARVVVAFRMKKGEDNPQAYAMVGEGVVPKQPLDSILKNRTAYRDWIWLWDGNHDSADSEMLRREGFLVFGGHELTDKMEHDRNFGMSLIKKAGLSYPEYQEFDDIQAGLEYLDENEDSAFVFKCDEPDDVAWVTTVPDSDNDAEANREIYKFLASQEEGKGKFILQQRKKGIEINVEVWLHEGKPFFAHANFECKKKDNRDLGRMIGCSQDIEFVIPVGARIVRDTLAKLIALPEFKAHTGPVDLNLIVADNEYYFLEFCARLGYNAHPNLFTNLAISPLPQIFADWVTGNTAGFGRHFRAGFGASVTLWIDKPVMCLPLTFNEDDARRAFYHFDTYREDDGDYYLAGYANEVGIMCAHDYDMMSAAEEVLRRFERIHYPGRTGRTDLGKEDYLSNPHERYVAARAMNLFDVTAD